MQAVNGVPVKSSAEATRRIQQAAPGVLQLLIMPAGVRERIKADAKLRSGAQTPEASPKPVKERVPLTRRLSFSRRRSSSKGVFSSSREFFLENIYCLCFIILFNIYTK